MNVFQLYDKYLSVLVINPQQVLISLEFLKHMQFQHLKNIPFQNRLRSR